MIKIMENGVRIIVLGRGTTKIGGARLDGDDFERAIIFTNTGPSGYVEASDLPSDAVIIRIDNIQGAMSYIRGLWGILKSWPFEPQLKAALAEAEQETIALIESLNARERVEEALAAAKEIQSRTDQSLRMTALSSDEQRHWMLLEGRRRTGFMIWHGTLHGPSVEPTEEAADQACKQAMKQLGDLGEYFAVSFVVVGDAWPTMVLRPH